MRSLIIIAVAILSFSFVSADTLVKPYNFTSGTKAKASEINENFDALFSQVNKLARPKNMVVKNNNEEIGFLVSLSDYDFWFITSKGYHAFAKFDTTNLKWQLGSLSMFYQSADCSGDKYAAAPINTRVFRNGDGDLYYIAKDAQMIAGTYYSYKSPDDGACLSLTLESKFSPALPNSESTTGISSTEYLGPITISIE